MQHIRLKDSLLLISSVVHCVVSPPTSIKTSVGPVSYLIYNKTVGFNTWVFAGTLGSLFYGFIITGLTIRYTLSLHIAPDQTYLLGS